MNAIPLSDDEFPLGMRVVFIENQKKGVVTQRFSDMIAIQVDGEATERIYSPYFHGGMFKPEMYSRVTRDFMDKGGLVEDAQLRCYFPGEQPPANMAEAQSESIPLLADVLATIANERIEIRHLKPAIAGVIFSRLTGLALR